MKNYNIVEYWNQRENPCSKTIDKLTDKHSSYLSSQTIGCRKILDFGPGYGRLFSSYNDVDEVVGVDVTEQHKEALFKEAEKQGFDFKFICKKSNFDHLDFPDKYFDALVASEVLFHQTPDIVENIMKELLRISQKVVVISYMNPKEQYDAIGKHVPSQRYCFNYNYYQICKKNNWNLRNEERVRNQIFFVYSDIFQFKYRGKKVSFLFDRDDYYMSRIIKKNGIFYENKYLDYLMDSGIINANSSVVDIGAYLGNHAIYFSKIIGCKWLYCFEPTAYSYSILLDNLKNNGIENSFCFRFAVGSKNRMVSVFRSNPDNPGANQYKYSKSGVQCVTLDSIIPGDINFIKIDVENMEMDVLDGCETIVSKFRPIIMVEVGNKQFIQKWMENHLYQRVEKHIFNKNTWLLKGRK